ncbi:low molecular weight protein-tyrosine-phosphatase [Umezawaea sp.]|uniref:low molecular weight protein-tyrosine-phosphatase n=1 Tax=Umezawaea sp. TaxID=1955258 RepID=UPI002ED59BA6
MHVSFIGSTNTCRSPMAALVFREHLHREGIAERVRVTSAGTGLWLVGAPTDRRATAVLVDHGYPVGHVAAPLGSDHLNASLLVALDSGHARTLRRLVTDPDRVRLLRSFDPVAGEDVDVPDPYYGGPAEYAEVLRMVESAVPGLLDRVCDELDRA